MGMKQIVDLIRDGETVAPGVANRAIRELDQNVRYLAARLDAAEIGSTVYIRAATVEPQAAVGMPVYFNARTQRFERGLAQLDTELGTGILVNADSAEIWGVVASKADADLADILIFGFAPVDLTAAVGGRVQAGVYYLSGQTAGRLVAQRPPVSIPVLRADGAGNVFVNPKFVDILESHRHYHFELWPFPAGHTTSPAPGGTHVITNGNPALRGWLPANHSVFGGLAPAGAKFGYNLAMDKQLEASWPPLPVHNAYLEWSHLYFDQTGHGDFVQAGYEGVPMGHMGLAIIDRNGIWWMSDRYGEVPWPVAFNTGNSASFFSEFDESIADEYPEDILKRIGIWFTKMTLADDTMAVTTLASRDERLKVYCAGTNVEGKAGALELDLDLNLIQVDDMARGPLAIKGMTGDTLHRGPVAEGLYAASNNVSLSGDASFALPNGRRMYYGAVGVSVVSDEIRELKCLLVRLEGVTEENFPAIYLGLPADSESRYTAIFEVPLGLPRSGLLSLVVRALGRSAGTLPTLTLESMIVSRPVPGGDPVTVPSAWTPLTFSSSVPDSLSIVTGQVVELVGDAISVAAGDLVYFRVTRVAPDGYSGDVGILEQVGIVGLGAMVI